MEDLYNELMNYKKICQIERELESRIDACNRLLISLKEPFFISKDEKSFYTLKWAKCEPYNPPSCYINVSIRQWRAELLRDDLKSGIYTDSISTDKARQSGFYIIPNVQCRHSEADIFYKLGGKFYMAWSRFQGRNRPPHYIVTELYNLKRIVYINKGEEEAFEQFRRHRAAIQIQRWMRKTVQRSNAEQSFVEKNVSFKEISDTLQERNRLKKAKHDFWYVKNVAGLALLKAKRPYVLDYNFRIIEKFDRLPTTPYNDSVKVKLHHRCIVLEVCETEERLAKYDELYFADGDQYFLLDGYSIVKRKGDFSDGFIVTPFFYQVKLSSVGIDVIFKQFRQLSAVRRIQRYVRKVWFWRPTYASGRIGLESHRGIKNCLMDIHMEDIL